MIGLGEEEACAKQLLAKKMLSAETYVESVMSLNLKFIRNVLKAALRSVGFVFFTRPNKVIQSGRPWAFYLKDFQSSPVFVVGPICFWNGRVRLATFGDKGVSQYISEIGGRSSAAPVFAVSSFLNTVVPEEKWSVSVRKNSRHTSEPLISAGLGRGMLVDGRAMKSHNYFHFLLQVLPQILRMGESGALVLRQSEITPWQQSVFDAFGVASGPVAIQTPIRDKLERTPGIYPSSTALRTLRRAFLSRYQNTEFLFQSTSPSHGRKPRLLFIDRSDATSRAPDRRVGGAEVLGAELSETFDVKLEELGQHSFLQQVELVNWADVICGPSGAGFSNVALCFQDPGPMVIDLVSPANARWHWERVSLILGFSYRRIAVPSDKRGVFQVSPSMVVDAWKEMTRASVR